LVRPSGAAVAAALILLWTAAPARAQFFDESVELFFSPSETTVEVGDTFTLGLVVRSLNEGEHAISGLDAVLTWDPEVLMLTGKIDNGPYAWGRSLFPNRSQGDLDFLNDDWSDGDAFYQAISRLLPDPPAFAPAVGTDGLLVTSFVFEALSPSGAGGTIVDLPLTFAEFSRTQVISGVTPAFDMLDQVTPATVTILPEPTVMAFLLSAAGVYGWRRRPQAALLQRG
jgi:hypothetical protein